MRSRNYERLDIETFGRTLLKTGDLDPIYIALHKLKSAWSEDQMCRWLVSYWHMYHAGSACYMSQMEGEDFWAVMQQAATNTFPAPTGGRWPRGSERRHFRGNTAEQAVSLLKRRYGNRPQDMVAFVAGEGGPYPELAKRAQEHYACGKWISFKMGDMVDRVLGTHVDFSESAVFMFDDPVKAALMLWRQKVGLPDSAMPKSEEHRKEIIHGVVQYLREQFADMKAPPSGDRAVDLQEIETVLCKWKSHMNGHYPLLNDTHEIREGLEPWMPHSSAAFQFSAAFPKGEYLD